MRVDGPPARGVCRRVASLRSGGGSGSAAEGCDSNCAAIFKVSVTGFTFSVIWHEKHYGNQPPPVAFPLWCLTAPPSPRGIGRATKGKRLYGQARRLTSPDLHILCRMCTVDNKALKGSLFICDSTVSTGYSAPACGGGKGTGFIGEPRDPRIQ